MPRNRDLFTALIVGAFAVTLLLAGTNLPMGTAARMGPGFIPRSAAIGLLLIAAAIAFRGWLALHEDTATEDVAPFHWRGTASIGGGVLAFALLVQPAGLLISAIFAVFVSSLAQQGARFGERIALAGFLAAFVGLVFPVALGLPISLLPTFL